MEAVVTNRPRLQRLGIPSRFQVFNHTITIKEILEEDCGQHGDWDSEKGEIRLFTNGISDSLVVHTYYHEFMHCLMYYAGYPEESSDETKMDVLGGLIAQALQTSK